MCWVVNNFSKTTLFDKNLYSNRRYIHTLFAISRCHLSVLTFSFRDWEICYLIQWQDRMIFIYWVQTCPEFDCSEKNRSYLWHNSIYKYFGVKLCCTLFHVVPRSSITTQTCNEILISELYIAFFIFIRSFTIQLAKRMIPAKGWIRFAKR